MPPTGLTLIELLEYVRGKATSSGRQEDGFFSATSGEAGLPRLHGARFEDDAEETVSTELTPSPDLWIGVALPGNAAGIITAGARRPFLLRQLIVVSQEKVFTLGVNVSRL